MATEHQNAQEKVLQGEVAEILEEIFVHVMGDIEVEGLPGSTAAYPELWRQLAWLTEVSKPWRSIAQTTPRLWGNIFHGHIGDLYETRGDQCPRKYFFSLTVCLERSGSLPLQIAGSRLPWIGELLDTINKMNANHRIHQLTLRTDAAVLQSDSEAEVEGHRKDPLAWIADVALPRLKHLVLEATEIDSFLLGSHLYKILAQLPTLEEFTARRACWPSDDDRDIEDIVYLPFLTVLHLEVSKPDMEFFFGIISAPDLRDVTVVLVDDRRRFGDHPLAVVANDGPWNNLSRLTIGECVWSLDLSHFLMHTPHLEELRLRPMQPAYGEPPIDQRREHVHFETTSILLTLIRTQGPNHSYVPVPELKRLVLTHPDKRLECSVNRLSKAREDRGMPIEIEIMSGYDLSDEGM